MSFVFDVRNWFSDCDDGGTCDTELPYLWQKLDASVLALERLSAAVNKPDELERLIGESKKLLKHTAASPGAASTGRFCF